MHSAIRCISLPLAFYVPLSDSWSHTPTSERMLTHTHPPTQIHSVHPSSFEFHRIKIILHSSMATPRCVHHVIYLIRPFVARFQLCHFWWCSGVYLFSPMDNWKRRREIKMCSYREKKKKPESAKLSGKKGPTQRVWVNKKRFSYKYYPLQIKSQMELWEERKWASEMGGERQWETEKVLNNLSGSLNCTVYVGPGTS